MKFTVRGGHFDKADGSFMPGEGFVLEKDRKQVRGLEIERTALAVHREVERMGGEQLFGEPGIVASTLVCCKESEYAFIVRFKCGRALLATAENETCWRVAKMAPFPIEREPTTR